MSTFAITGPTDLSDNIIPVTPEIAVEIFNNLGLRIMSGETFGYYAVYGPDAEGKPGKWAIVIHYEYDEKAQAAYYFVHLDEYHPRKNGTAHVVYKTAVYKPIDTVTVAATSTISRTSATEKENIMTKTLRSDMFHSDGCIRANTNTKPFRVTYLPNCDHTKIRGAEIVILAVDASHALAYAQKWLRLPEMTPVTAVPVADDSPAV